MTSFECPDLLQLLAIYVPTHCSGPLAKQDHVNAVGWTLVAMATALEDANRSHEFQQGSSAVHFKIMTDIVCEHQLPVSLLLKRVLGLSDGLPVSIESDLVSALALKPFRTMPVVPALAELPDTPTPASLPRRPFGSTVDELLGCHFHLVREDMLGPVRTDLKKGVANTQPMKTLYNVHVTGVHRDEVVMSFELHKDHACHKMSDDRKRDFWERTSILRLHGLVLLLDNGRPVRLAFVTGRQHVLQNKVGLTFQDREDVDVLLQELERPCEHRTVFTLTSIAPSFFLY